MTALALQVARSFSLFLSVVLVIALVHKLTAIRIGTAEEEPLLMISPWRARHARLLLLAAAVTETAVVAGLILWPSMAAFIAAALFAAYLRDLRHLSGDAPCNCLGRFLNLPARRLELRRNAVLLGLSIAVAAIGLSAGRVAPLSQTNVGLGMVEFALFVSFVWVATLLSRSGVGLSRNQPRPSELGKPVTPTVVIHRRSMPA